MGIGKRKNFKTFWPNGDFCPVGTGKNKVSDSLDQTAVFVKGVLGDEKSRILSFKAAPHGPVRSGKKKSSVSLDQTGTSCPLGSGG